MKAMWLWHPESPGDKVLVVRNWWQRFWFPTAFATRGEVLRWYAVKQQMTHSKVVVDDEVTYD